MIKKGLIRINKLNLSGQQTSLDSTISDRDFKNVLYILDFCLKHQSFPNNEILAEINNELLYDYEYNGYRLKPENQELFVNLSKKIYKNDPKKWDKVV